MSESRNNQWLCALPWVHLRQNADSCFSPCCNFVEDPALLPKRISYQEAFHSSYFQQIRKDFLEGKDLPQCSRCMVREKGGAQSMRQKSLLEFGEAWLKEPAIRYLEINLGNHCNLKCRSCDSNSSSRWISDEIQMGKNPSPEFEFHLEDLNHSLDQVESVKILGGEPFLSPKHLPLLLKLDREKGLENISLHYSTNGTTRVSHEVLLLWKKARSLSVYFSVDGLYEHNDFFRHGSNFTEWLDHVRWFEKNVKNADLDLGFHTVVNIYNIFSLEELDDFLVKEFPDFWLTKDCLVNPAWLDIRNLPEEAKLECRERFAFLAEKFRDQRKRRQAYSYIERFLQEPSSAGFDLFLKKHGELNRIRKIELAPVNDELRKWMQNFSEGDLARHGSVTL